MGLNADDGIPVMRPLFLDFESDDQGAWDQDYEYMYGPDLLVAPITEPGVESWEVYLPGSGQDWVWLWDASETPMAGQQTVTVEAPMGMTPVFYRAESTWVELFRQIRDEFSLL